MALKDFFLFDVIKKIGNKALEFFTGGSIAEQIANKLAEEKGLEEEARTLDLIDDAVEGGFISKPKRRLILKGMKALKDEEERYYQNFCIIIAHDPKGPSAVEITKNGQTVKTMDPNYIHPGLKRLRVLSIAKDLDELDELFESAGIKQMYPYGAVDAFEIWMKKKGVPGLGKGAQKLGEFSVRQKEDLKNGAKRTKDGAKKAVRLTGKWFIRISLIVCGIPLLLLIIAALVSTKSVAGWIVFSLLALALFIISTLRLFKRFKKTITLERVEDDGNNCAVRFLPAKED